MNDQSDAPEYQLNNVAAEQAVLGCVLLNNDVFDAVDRILRSPDVFSDEVHRRIYDCAARMIGDGKIASPVTMKTFLGDHVLGEGMTMPVYLARIAAQAPAPLNAPDYAQIVADLAARRELEKTAEELRSLARDAPIETSPAKIAAHAVETLDSIVREADTRNYRTTIGKAASAALERAQRATKGEAFGYRTGLRALDNKIGVMSPGDMIVIAGRPGMGKSAVAQEIVLNVALADDRNAAAIFSLEMSAEQNSHRMLSSLILRGDQPSIPYKKIARGDLTDDQIGELWGAQRVLSKLPIEIDAQPRLSISQIGARARRMRQKFADKGKRLAVVVVDHIGLIAAQSRRDANREREVAEISASIKEMAKDLGCPVVALSQLSRRIEERKIEERRPEMSDLRESGAIEQDADIVIGVYREFYYLSKLANPSDAQVARLNSVRNNLELIVLKNRMDATGTALQRVYIASNYITDLVEDRQDDLALEREDALI